MEKLQAGYRRFRREVFPSRRSLYERAAEGQRPQALVITCSDSRVDPELLTMSGPGDIFVERNPGNLVPPYRDDERVSVSASVEFAVTLLGVRDVVVCGHTNCGAVAALLAPDTVAGVPAVARWLEHGKPALSRLSRDSDVDILRQLTEANVVTQLEHLRTHPSVARGLSAGTLTLHGLVFDIRHGTLSAWHPGDQAFHPWDEGSVDVCPI